MFGDAGFLVVDVLVGKCLPTPDVSHDGDECLIVDRDESLVFFALPRIISFYDEKLMNT
jgi:hypothetical protein